MLLDKPVGITSFQVIRILKNFFPQKTKIGHCGTLDPFASGFLLIAIGKATKLVEYAMDFEKSYSFTMRWGIETDTDDHTGKVINHSIIIPQEHQILSKKNEFIGNINQIPPTFSAVKINGVRSYQYARKNIRVLLQSKKVTLKKISLISHHKDVSEFSIITSKGFYVRSFARDLARSLNTFAHVIKLRRNVNGIFCKKHLIDCKKIKDFLHSNQTCDYIMDRLLPFDYTLTGIPTYEADLVNTETIKQKRYLKIKLQQKDCSKVLLKNNSKIVAVCLYNNGLLKVTKIL